MAKLLTWSGTGERYYETGLSMGVLYPRDTALGTYPEGVVWNGLTGVTESPAGAELTKIYADDMEYAALRAAETFGATIEAYTYPDEFAECDGSAATAVGVYLGQQKRTTFGLAYRTKIGNDVDEDLGYKLHLIYGATASPSEKAYTSINESPEAITFSWELDTSPVAVTGYKPTAHIEIDSTKVDATKLTALEVILYGTAATTEPVAAAVPGRLPLPDEIVTMFAV